MAFTYGYPWKFVLLTLKIIGVQFLWRKGEFLCGKLINGRNMGNLLGCRGGRIFKIYVEKFMSIYLFANLIFISATLFYVYITNYQSSKACTIQKHCNPHSARHLSSQASSILKAKLHSSVSTKIILSISIEINTSPFILMKIWNSISSQTNQNISLFSKHLKFMSFIQEALLGKATVSYGSRS